LIASQQWLQRRALQYKPIPKSNEVDSLAVQCFGIYRLTQEIDKLATWTLLRNSQ
jgi:hypothetical protein